MTEEDVKMRKGNEAAGKVLRVMVGATLVALVVGLVGMMDLPMIARIVISGIGGAIAGVATLSLTAHRGRNS